MVLETQYSQLEENFGNLQKRLNELENEQKELVLYEETDKQRRAIEYALATIDFNDAVKNIKLVFFFFFVD